MTSSTGLTEAYVRTACKVRQSSYEVRFLSGVWMQEKARGPEGPREDARDLLGRDHAASDPVASIAGWICLLVIGLRVDHQGGSAIRID